MRTSFLDSLPDEILDTIHLKTVPNAMSEGLTLSFEVFPPRTEPGWTKMPGILQQLYRWNPTWISCTYGAGGTDKGRNVDICRMLVEDGKTIPVTHYNCIHHTREDVLHDIQNYLDLGVFHVLALRGDFLPGESETHGDFQHANQLLEFLNQEFEQDLVTACSGIPEGHILSPNMASDIAFLKRKQDAGAQFIITQLTFDMDQFARWRDQIAAAGVYLPISVGIMPVLDRDKCIRHCLSMNGTSIPRKLARLISRYYDDPVSFKDAGMDYTVQQMYEYVQLGIQDLHLYALNQPASIHEVLQRSGLFPCNPE